MGLQLIGCKPTNITFEGPAFDRSLANFPCDGPEGWIEKKMKLARPSWDGNMNDRTKVVSQFVVAFSW